MSDRLDSNKIEVKLIMGQMFNRGLGGRLSPKIKIALIRVCVFNVGGRREECILVLP